MFIKTKNKEELLSKLEENKDKDVVIHYNCSDCDDEQVTNEEEAEFILEQLKKHGYLVPHLDCTNCGSHTGILSPDYIQGIELM